MAQTVERHRKANSPKRGSRKLPPSTVSTHSGAEKLGYRPALDGMRAFAVVAVMLFHFQVFRYFRGGWEAVDIFFVLSGFLITTLLYEEHVTIGRISLSKFYARRALRLFPALATVVIIWTIIFFLFRNHAWLWQTTSQKGTVPPDPIKVAVKSWLGTLTYSTNWLRVFGNPTFPLNHFWTLAIEEQFYLAWPFLLLRILRFRRCDLMTMGLAAVSAIWCAAVWMTTNSYQHAGFGTDCQASSLLIGAALALAWKKGTLAWIPDWAVRAAAIFAITGLIGCLFLLGDLISLDFLGFITLIAGATATLILWLLRTDRQPWLLTNPWVVYIGKISYALYLWHVLFAEWLYGTGFLGAAVGIGLSFLAAVLSRHLIELPALRRKTHYEVVGAKPV